ncbi:MAG: hypothetical protein WC130_12535 [Kiritimatiellia bacterium]|jgi:hypothetical protein
MSRALSEFSAIIGMLIGVAIVAVLVGQKSKTSEVIQAFGGFFTNVLSTVLKPVS